MSEEFKAACRNIADHVAKVIRTQYGDDEESYQDENFYFVEIWDEDFRYLVKCDYRDGEIDIQLDGLKEEFDILDGMEVDIKDPNMDQKILDFIAKATDGKPGSDIDRIADSLDEDI